MMKITDRMKQIDGVVDARYDFDKMALGLIIKPDADKSTILLKAWKIVSDLQLNRSIEMIGIIQQ